MRCTLANTMKNEESALNVQNALNTCEHERYCLEAFEYVQATAGQPPLSQMLANRQAGLYRRIMQMPSDSFVRCLVCTPSGEPMRWDVPRKRGRPRQMWAQRLYAQMMASV